MVYVHGTHVPALPRGDWGMTPGEFQRKYHDYMTRDREAGRRERAAADRELQGNRAVLVDFGGVYGLMLLTAVMALPRIGIPIEVEGGLEVRCA